MFSLSQIIELFAVVVLAVSIVGIMWLAGHIYLKYLNWKQSQQDKSTPPPDEDIEKLVAWWRD